MKKILNSHKAKKVWHILSEWLTPRADYFFTFIWLVCILVFNEQFNNTILLAFSYVVTLLLIYYFVKYKNVKSHKYSVAFLILYCILVVLGIGIFTFSQDNNNSVVFGIQINNMSPNYNEGDIVHIQNMPIYERGDSVIFDKCYDPMDIIGATTQTEEVINALNSSDNFEFEVSTPTAKDDSNNSTRLDLTLHEVEIIIDPCPDVWIGRVIGFPTEKIHIQNGDVFINDTALSEPYVYNKFPKSYLFDYIVPVGSYFILQDNRETRVSTYDSIDAGGIIKKHIRGKVINVFNSATGMFKQQLSAWLLILITYLLPLLVSRRFKVPKIIKVFVSQYNLLCLFILSIFILYFPFTKDFSHISWYYPSIFYYQTTTFIQEFTVTSPFSLPLNLILTLIGGTISIMEIQDYIGKIKKSSHSK